MLYYRSIASIENTIYLEELMMESDSIAGRRPRPEQCHNLLQGYCYFGTECRFSHGQIACEMCDEKKINIKCIDCELRMCHDCDVFMHRKRKKGNLSFHKTVKKDEDSGDDKDKKHIKKTMAELTITYKSKKDLGAILMTFIRDKTVYEPLSKIIVTKFKYCNFFVNNNTREFDHTHMYEFLNRINTKGNKKQREGRRYKPMNYLDANQTILQAVFVRNMLAAEDGQCQQLNKLDVVLLLHIITNGILEYQLNKSPFYEVLNVRNTVYHSADENFQRKEFNESLISIWEALQEIYKIAKMPLHQLDQQIEELKRKVDPDNSVQILRHIDISPAEILETVTWTKISFDYRIEKEFHEDLADERSPQYSKLKREYEKKVSDLLKRHSTEPCKVFVKRFKPGSVITEIEVTVTEKTEAAAIELVTKAFKESGIEGLDASSIKVEVVAASGSGATQSDSQISQGGSTGESFCEMCEERQIHITCIDCGLQMCHDCDAYIHRKGKLALHRRSKLASHIRSNQAKKRKLNSDSIEEKTPKKPAPSVARDSKDPGLFLLLPLYQLLRGTCLQTIFKIVVTKFQICEFYRKKDPDPNSYIDQDLSLFLKKINSIGTNRQKKIKGRPQDIQQEKRSWQIYNLKDNMEILQAVTVRNLLDADERQCGPLKNLALDFLLNIVTNAILIYPLSESAHKSVNQVKEIRNGLMHAKYNFSKKDFNNNLEKLHDALKEIYKDFSIPTDDLDKQIKECKQEIIEPDPSQMICTSDRTSAWIQAQDIFMKLQEEIHDRYKDPQHFVCPTIREDCDGEGPVVESLEIYIRDHYSKPLLLCGKRGSGIISILQNQAYQLVQKIKYAQYQDQSFMFSLVILLEEKPHGVLKKKNFWEMISNSIKNLAPKTAEMYGIETLMAVIKIHIKETIFFVNWTLQDITGQFQETSNGTWIFTYQGNPGTSADWNILNTEPLIETQVYQLLHSLNPKPRELEIINEKYRVCNFKDVLTTPNMVMIFNELSNERGLGTEFELMIKYVEKKMDEGDVNHEVIRAVGKLAFEGIRISKQQFRIYEVEEIDESGQLAFFTKIGNHYELIHNVSMDFLASIYLIEDLNNDQNNSWQKLLDNTTVFKIVFKFACSFWFRDVDHNWKKTVKRGVNKERYLKKVEDFLCNFLFIKKSRTERKPGHKSNEKQVHKSKNVDGTSSKIELDIDNQINTNENMDIDDSEKEEKEMLISGNPVRNPFSKWGFLVHIDEACDGIREVLDMLADLLSYCKCWVFKCKELNDSKMKRVQKILKRVKLNPSDPVIIKIESGPSCDMLKKIWIMLKNEVSLYDAVKVRINIMHEKKEGKCQILDDRTLRDLPDAIVNAHAAVYITEINMPVIIPKIQDFKFSMCECIKKLEYLDAVVYDINSLREVLVCGKLPNMKSIKINVNLRVGEVNIDNPPKLEIPNPKNINVNLTLVYFKDIQKLLDAFTCRHRLLSLSIRGVVVDNDFKLNISAFKNMESLYLHCDTPVNVQLRSNCALLLALNLTLPKHLERLLLSNVQFYNDTNIHFFRNFFAKYDIQRLMILDSNLSLDGARKVLKQHMFKENETDLDLETNIKKMKIDKSDSPDLKKPLAKDSRLPKEDREERQKNKPKGKEIIITSNTEMKYNVCNSRPCQCGINCTTNRLEDLSDLIEDTYRFSILSFSFNNENVTVRKDLCNDLRVHCPLFRIKDIDVNKIEKNELPSNSTILKLFQSLTLAQSLYIVKTDLSYDGVITLITIMERDKRKLCRNNLVEPFSLTVTSDNHPIGDVLGMNSRIVKFLKQQSCIKMFNFWCTCENRCHKLKKTHAGDIFANDVKF